MIRKFFLALLLCTSLGQVFAQGLNNGFYFGYTGCEFASLVVKEDTIFLSGVVIDTSGHHSSIPFICKLTINGELISLNHIQGDSLRFYVLKRGLDASFENILISNTSAKGGSNLETGGFIGMFDKDLNQLAFLDYHDTLLRSQNILRTYAVSDTSYLALATEQGLDYNVNVKTYMLDRNLHITSKKTYYSPAGDYCEFGINLIKMAEDTFMLCAFQSPCVGHVERTNTMLVQIHANGDTMSSWVDPGEDSMDIYDLYRLSDGGYICGGIKLDTLNSYYGIRGYNAFIARLDSNYNRQWLRRTGTLYVDEVMVNRVLPIDSNTFLDVGQDYELPTNDISCGYKIAFIEQRRVSDGSLIWRRNYKNLADTSCYTVGGRWDENKLHDITILPDHSIVACGEFINWADTSHPQQGWLIKVNENGCFSADCSDTTWMNSVSTIPSQNIKMSIFPNPASDQVAVEIINRGDEINDAMLSVYDMSGQLVHSYAHINTQTTYFLNIKNYAAGNYILRLEEHGLLLGTANLMKE